MDETQTIFSQLTKGATVGEKGLIDMNLKRSATAKVIKVAKFWFFQEKTSAI
jgi:CRP-like cAMP-binding protein|tara:strand:+ start:279 stop:434 length:156 start_codon:yes stop_codon:yes gene_type:complete